MFFILKYHVKLLASLLILLVKVFVEGDRKSSINTYSQLNHLIVFLNQHLLIYENQCSHGIERKPSCLTCPRSDWNQVTMNHVHVHLIHPNPTCSCCMQPAEPIDWDTAHSKVGCHALYFLSPPLHTCPWPNLHNGRDKLINTCLGKAGLCHYVIGQKQ